MELPKKIYLQLNEEELNESTWCQDQLNDTDTQYVEMDDETLSFVIDAVNAYWNDANWKLRESSKPLGTIERRNLKGRWNRAKAFFKKFC